MKLIYIIASICLIALLWFGCREVYDPEINQEDLELLVVEGHIEMEGGKSEVKLSYTSPVGSGQAEFTSVSDAVVNILLRQKNGEEQFYPMHITHPGTYVNETYLSPEHQYRLSINIPNKGLYLSDWITPIISPPIEEVGFTQKEDNDIEIHVNTHGTETAEYFIWEFDETWIFSTPHTSFLKYKKLSEQKDTMIFRTPDEMIDKCFLSDKSTNIIIGSSGQYQNDYIFQKKIQYIPSGSEKLGHRYSIFVRQRAISKEAYEFYEILRKNSADVGGIFSPLPSVMSTNIYHQDDAEKKAVGFLTAGRSVEKRIFIDRTEIPYWQVRNPFYAGCEFSVDTIPLADIKLYFGNNSRIPLSGVLGPFGINYVAYLGASRKCADCRVRGTKTKPDFWEN